MRISDWSSDVCSSDLNGFDIEIRFQRLMVLPYLVGLIRLIPVQRIPVFERINGYGSDSQLVARTADSDRDFTAIGNEYLFDVHGFIFPVLRLFAQIGRASCRERVCQYV